MNAITTANYVNLPQLCNNCLALFSKFTSLRVALLCLPRQKLKDAFARLRAAMVDFSRREIGRCPPIPNSALWTINSSRVASMCQTDSRHLTYWPNRCLVTAHYKVYYGFPVWSNGGSYYENALVRRRTWWICARELRRRDLLKWQTPPPGVSRTPIKYK